MDGVSQTLLLEIIKNGGLVGFVLVLGYVNVRWQDRRDERREALVLQMLETYRKDSQSYMTQSRNILEEVVERYDNNSQLVKDTQRIADQTMMIAREMTSLVSLNTQVQTRLAEKIEHNMSCPIASGRVERPR